jgi:hypothetical protein
LFLGLLQSFTGDSLRFISDLDGVETAEQADAFAALIDLARKAGMESKEFEIAFNSFLQSYGSFRACDELELASKRWISDPSYLLTTIRSACVGESRAREKLEAPANPGGITGALVDRCRMFCRLVESRKTRKPSFLTFFFGSEKTAKPRLFGCLQFVVLEPWKELPSF